MTLSRLAAIVILLLAGTAASVVAYLDSRAPEVPRVWMRSAHEPEPKLGTSGFAPEAPRSESALPSPSSPSEPIADRTREPRPAAGLGPRPAEAAEALAPIADERPAPIESSRWTRIRRVGLSAPRSSRSVSVGAVEVEGPAPDAGAEASAPPVPLPSSIAPGPTMAMPD